MHKESEQRMCATTLVSVVPSLKVPSLSHGSGDGAAGFVHHSSAVVDQGGREADMVPWSRGSRSDEATTVEWMTASLSRLRRGGCMLRRDRGRGLSETWRPECASERPHWVGMQVLGFRGRKQKFSYDMNHM